MVPPCFRYFSLHQVVPPCLWCFQLVPGHSSLYNMFWWTFLFIWSCKTIFPLSTKINLSCFALCIELHTKSELFQIIRLLGRVYHFSLLICCPDLFYFQLWCWQPFRSVNFLLLMTLRKTRNLQQVFRS